MSNFVLQEEIKKISKHIREGLSLAQTFSRSVVIPEFMASMVTVGEESGQIEKSLLKVAQSYEKETDAAIKVMLSLLEPLLILGLALIVGFIVISMLLPIFEINFMAR